MSGDDEKKAPAAGSKVKTRNSGSLAATVALGPEETVIASAPPNVDSHADTIADTGEREASASSRSPASSVDDLIGTTLQNRYKISRKIGQGGMGAVYEAEHISLRKKVAIKVLLDKYATKDTVVARLEQEARLASSIGHDHIVDITDFGETATGRTFVVMEYLEGESVGSVLSREGPIAAARTIHIARQTASALGAAHKKGIIHRDIKPENVFLRRRDGKDSVKVVDFGISKTMRPDDESPDSSPRLTQTGMVLGTPLYMSPEQARGDDDPDHRVDIYSLGVIMYEAVTGEVPFHGTNYLHIVSQVLSKEPKPPRELRPELSEDFEEVILKALAKEPEDRYQTMEELDADLAILQGQDGMSSTAARITASRRRRKARRGGAARLVKWVTGAAAIGSLVVIAVMLSNNRSSNDDGKAVQGAIAAPSVDAGPTHSTPDAAAPAAYEFAFVKITSEPSGATLWDGPRQLGTTPHDWRKLKTNKMVKIYFELDGYDDSMYDLIPVEEDGKTVFVRLKRAKKGQAKKLRPGAVGAGTGTGTGTGKKPHDDGGGDISSPYKNKK